MKQNFWPKLIILATIIVTGFFLGLNSKKIKFALLPIRDDQFILKQLSNHCSDQYFSGDLWISTNGEDLKQITQGQCIDKVLALSPNKKYAMVTVTSFNNGHRLTSLGVVNLASGSTKIIRGGNNYTNYRLGYWLSDKEIANFIAPRIGETNLKIEAINIDNAQTRIIGDWPIGITAFNDQVFSDNKQWAVGNDYQMDKPFTVELFSFDQLSKTKHTIINGKNVKFVAWDKDKIIYLNKVDGQNSVWITDALGAEKEKLGELGNKEVVNFAVSGDRKNLVYSTVDQVTKTPEIDIDHNWFIFNLTSRQNQEIKFSESFVKVLSLSQDGDRGVFLKKDTHELFVANIDSLEVVRICGAGKGCEITWPN